MALSATRAIVACGLALVAAPGSAGPSPSNAAACLAVTVDQTPPRAEDDTARGFSVDRAESLDFQVVLGPGVPPESLVLKLFTPNGHLYQQIELPVAAEGSRETERALPGYPFPVKVATVRTRRAASGQALRTVAAPPVPVAGTTIVSSALYGTWRVEVGRDPTSKGCSARFSLRP